MPCPLQNAVEQTTPQKKTGPAQTISSAATDVNFTSETAAGSWTVTIKSIILRSLPGLWMTDMSSKYPSICGEILHPF